MDDKTRELTYTEYKEYIITFYKSHNIIRERSELYYDFLFSLINTIDETYLGNDILKTEDDIRNHFNWCFNKVVNDFEKERIYFNNRSNNYESLFHFLMKTYYISDQSDKVEGLILYFYTLMNIYKMKSMAEIDSFLDIYKLFDENLRKTN